MDLGADGRGNNNWNGVLAEFSFWEDYLLDANDINALYRGRQPWTIAPSSSEIRRFYPLWGLHSPEIDLGPAPLTASLVGAPPVVANPPITQFTPSLFRAPTFIPVTAPVGRTTKNTDTHPLGVHTAMSWRLNVP